MKKQTPPKSILFLTSDQFEDALVKSYQRFINSTGKWYSQNLVTKSDLLFSNTKRRLHGRLSAQNSYKRQTWDAKRALKKMVRKGHAPIRSQTVQDRNRV